MGSGKGTRPSSKQKPTHARIVENMNEAQLELEIDRNERKIKQHEKTMGANNWGNDNDYPFAVGQAKDGRQLRRDSQAMQKRTEQSRKYVGAMDERDRLIKQNENYKKALKQVKGTGKTQKELGAIKRKNATDKANKSSNLRWKQKQEVQKWGNRDVKVTTRTTGEYSIRSIKGSHSVYRNGERIARYDKLADAKAKVATDMSKGK